MNYQSCTIEELISFSNSGDIKVSVEIARRVSGGLLEEYDDAIYNLEEDVATLDAKYDELLEEEARLNQTIDELRESLSDLENELDNLESLDSIEFDTMELSLSDIECLGQYHEQADQLVFGE